MDLDQRIDTLEQRLSAMERKSRAWRILALLLLVVLIGGAASEGVSDNASWAADEKATSEKVTKFDVVEAKTLRIVNETGNVCCSIRTHGPFTNFSLKGAGSEDKAPKIVMWAVTGDSGKTDAGLSVVGGQKATSNTGVRVVGNAGTSHLACQGIGFRPKEVVDEQHRLHKRILLGKATESEHLRWNELSSQGDHALMGWSRTSGGYLVLRNPEEKTTSVINAGKLYLKTDDGKALIHAAVAKTTSSADSTTYSSSLFLETPPTTPSSTNDASVSVVNGAQATLRSHRFHMVNERNQTDTRMLFEKIRAVGFERLLPSEVARYKELAGGVGDIDLRIDRGPQISLKNWFGKSVINIQNNKMNQGGIYVNDVNGKLSRALSAP